MKRSSKKGFTLAELLIVIAIIAVLIAIMFPVFGAQIDKARAAAELANVRAKYSELVADKMLGADNDLTDFDGKIEIALADLEAARTDTTNTKVEYKAGANTGEPGTITVTYKNTYTGTFNVDADVTVTTTP